MKKKNKTKTKTITDSNITLPMSCMAYFFHLFVEDFFIGFL